MISDINEQDITQTVSEIQGMGVEALGVKANVALMAD